jgi:hypothetical protein
VSVLFGDDASRVHFERFYLSQERHGMIPVVAFVHFLRFPEVLGGSLEEIFCLSRFLIWMLY